MFNYIEVICPTNVKFWFVTSLDTLCDRPPTFFLKRIIILVSVNLSKPLILKLIGVLSFVEFPT